MKFLHTIRLVITFLCVTTAVAIVFPGKLFAVVSTFGKALVVHAQPPTLTIGLQNAPTVLDPLQWPQHSDGQAVSWLLYEPLLKISDGVIYNILATKWDTLSEEPYTFQLELRSDVQFHDGQFLTADHVITSWEHRQQVITDEQSILTMEKIDEQTVLIVMEPEYNSVEWFATVMEQVPIISIESTDGFPARFVGTGPYEVDTTSSTDNSNQLTFVPSPFWQGELPYAGALSFQYFETQSELLTAVQQKDVMGALEVDREAFNFIQDHQNEFRWDTRTTYKLFQLAAEEPSEETMLTISAVNDVIEMYADSSLFGNNDLFDEINEEMNPSWSDTINQNISSQYMHGWQSPEETIPVNEFTLLPSEQYLEMMHPSGLQIQCPALSCVTSVERALAFDFSNEFSIDIFSKPELDRTVVPTLFLEDQTVPLWSDFGKLLEQSVQSDENLLSGLVVEGSDLNRALWVYPEVNIPYIYNPDIPTVPDIGDVLKRLLPDYCHYCNQGPGQPEPDGTGGGAGGGSTTFFTQNGSTIAVNGSLVTAIPTAAPVVFPTSTPTPTSTPAPL